MIGSVPHLSCFQKVGGFDSPPARTEMSRTGKVGLSRMKFVRCHLSGYRWQCQEKSQSDSVLGRNTLRNMCWEV